MTTHTAWLQYILRLTSRIHARKELLARTTTAGGLLRHVFAIVLLEMILAVVSLPAYLLVSSKHLGGPKTKGAYILGFRLRRVVTLAALTVFLVVGGTKILLGSSAAWLIYGARDIRAAEIGWSFNDPMNYVYDVTEIQIVDGAAVLLADASATDQSTTLDIDGGVQEPESTSTDLPVIDDGAASEAPSDAEDDVEIPEEIIVAPEPTEEIPVDEAPPQVEIEAPPSDVPVDAPAEAPAGDVVSVQGEFRMAAVCTSTLRPIAPLNIPENVTVYRGFTEVALTNGGSITYQLSPDGGATWYTWGTSSWVVTTSETGVLASVVDQHMNVFPVTGSITFRAFFTSDCETEMVLYGVTVLYVEAATPSGPFNDLSAESSHLDFVNDNGKAITRTRNTAFVRYDANVAVHILVNNDVVIPSTAALVADGSSVWANVSVAIPGLSHLWIVIPKVADSEVRVCPNLAAGAPVASGCTGEILLAPTMPSSGGFSIMNIDDVDYWLIDGGLAPGAFGVTAFVRDTATPISCSAVPADDNSVWYFAFVGDRAVFRARVQDQWVIAQNMDDVTVTPNPDSTYRVQLVAGDGDLRARWWLLGTDEPKQYMLTAADDRLTAFDLGQRHDVERDCQTAPAVPENTAPVLVDLSGAQDAQRAVVTFVAQDAEGHYVDLVESAYSVTGAFAGEESAMTFAVGDERHEGTTALAASPPGVSHTLVWDLCTDLPAYAGSVSIRIQLHDGLEAGATSTTTMLVDCLGPNVTALSVVQRAGTDTVDITVSADDDAVGDLALTLTTSVDNGVTWVAPADLASLLLSSGTPSAFVWSANETYPETESDVVRIRAVVTDTLGNTGASFDSDAVSVDTDAPFGLSGLTIADTETNRITVAWSPVITEAHFDEYVLTITEDSTNTVMQAISSLEDPRCADMTTAGLVVSGLAADTVYRFDLVANDTFGHSSFLSTVGRTDVVIIEPPVDTTAPEAPILDQPESRVGAGDVVITGLMEPFASGRVTINDVVLDGVVFSANAEGTFSSTVSLTIGSHTIFVVAIDAAGNVSESSVSRTIIVNAEPVEGVGSGSIGTPRRDRVVEAEPEVSEPEPEVETMEPTPAIVVEIPVVEEEEQVPVVAPGRVSPEEIEAIATARVSPLFPAPTVASVRATATGRTFAFSGSAVPGASVAVFINSEEAVLYTTTAGSDGIWNIEHAQDDVTLDPGEHHVYALAYDAASRVKSEEGTVLGFSVERNIITDVMQYIDIPTGLATLVIAVVSGGLLIMVRKKNRVAV